MLKKLIISGFYLLFIFNNSFYSISQINENFEDGNFTTNPIWVGNVNDWRVVNGELNTNGPAVTYTFIYLSTPSALIENTKWEFYVNPKTSTSSGNYMDVFLTSDSSNLNGQNSGYFVRIGGTNDETSLFIKQEGVPTKIIDGTDGIISGTNNNPTKILVKRDNLNQWTLETDVTGTGNNYVLQGTTTNSVLTTSSFFGVLVKYSSSNAQKYFLDNINVETITADTIPPSVSMLNAISATQLDVYFEESVEKTSAENNTNYLVNNGIGNPASSQRDADNFRLVHLTFTNTFSSGNSYTLSITNVKDFSNNPTASVTSDFIYYEISNAVNNDIVINEIMADEIPTVGLPSGEFVELYNRSNKTFNLLGWSFSNFATFPNGVTLKNFIFLPNSFLILCSDADTSLFSPYGPVMGVGILPEIGDAEDLLTLKQGAIIINQINFTTAWYKDVNKANGGWTLELMNPDSLCACPKQWSASLNPSGGTPGKPNSLLTALPDTYNSQDNNELLSFYFNPHSTNLEFIFDDYLLKSYSEFFLIDIMGREIQRNPILENNVCINFNKYPTGLYLFLIKKDKRIIARGKFVY